MKKLMMTMTTLIIYDCLEAHVLLPGLTLVKHGFTYVLLKFYALVNSSTSCSKLSRLTFLSLCFTHGLLILHSKVKQQVKQQVKLQCIESTMQ